MYTGVAPRAAAANAAWYAPCTFTSTVAAGSSSQSSVLFMAAVLTTASPGPMSASARSSEARSRTSQSWCDSAMTPSRRSRASRTRSLPNCPGAPMTAIFIWRGSARSPLRSGRRSAPLDVFSTHREQHREFADAQRGADSEEDAAADQDGDGERRRVLEQRAGIVPEQPVHEPGRGGHRARCDADAQDA